jgi:hypothetical protein
MSILTILVFIVIIVLACLIWAYWPSFRRIFGGNDLKTALPQAMLWLKDLKDYDDRAKAINDAIQNITSLDAAFKNAVKAKYEDLHKAIDNWNNGTRKNLESKVNELWNHYKLDKDLMNSKDINTVPGQIYNKSIITEQSWPWNTYYDHQKLVTLVDSKKYDELWAEIGDVLEKCVSGTYILEDWKKGNTNDKNENMEFNKNKAKKLIKDFNDYVVFLNNKIALSTGSFPEPEVYKNAWNELMQLTKRDGQKCKELIISMGRTIYKTRTNIDEQFDISEKKYTDSITNKKSKYIVNMYKAVYDYFDTLKKEAYIIVDPKNSPYITSKKMINNLNTKEQILDLWKEIKKMSDEVHKLKNKNGKPYAGYDIEMTKTNEKAAEIEVDITRLMPILELPHEYFTKNLGKAEELLHEIKKYTESPEQIKNAEKYRDIIDFQLGTKFPELKQRIEDRAAIFNHDKVAEAAKQLVGFTDRITQNLAKLKSILEFVQGIRSDIYEETQPDNPAEALREMSKSQVEQAIRTGEIHRIIESAGGGRNAAKDKKTIDDRLSHNDHF